MAKYTLKQLLDDLVAYQVLLDEAERHHTPDGMRTVAFYATCEAADRRFQSAMAHAGTKRIATLLESEGKTLCAAMVRQLVARAALGAGQTTDDWLPLGADAVAALLVADSTPPAGATNQGEGKGGKNGKSKTPKRRRRKVDLATAKRRDERNRQGEIDKEIFAEWHGQPWQGYQDYVGWKNQNLPKGWPQLDHRYVALAIDREKGKQRRIGKWPRK